MSPERQDPGIRFLYEQNQRFHRSPSVDHVAAYVDAGDRPTERIAAYLTFLADTEYGNDGILTGDEASIRWQIAHTIYHVLQDITALSENDRAIHIDQFVSLLPWATYLGENPLEYPDWFRYYTFESVKKLTPYSDVEKTMPTRNGDTTLPFPEIDAGALDVVYRLLCARLAGQPVEGGFDDNGEEISFQQALRSGTFRHLYAYGLKTVGRGSVTPEMRERTEGQWVHYAQGSEPGEHFRALQSFGLEWCTATGFGQVVRYLNKGDLITYFTANDKGELCVPRVTIHTMNGRIEEVRGIEADQEVEARLIPALRQKLHTMQGAEDYLHKAHDVHTLARMSALLDKHPYTWLTTDEMIFLYELQRDITTFGHRRPDEIFRLRQLREFSDAQALPRLLPEAFRLQLNHAYQAYCEVAASLDQPIASRAEVDTLFALTELDWQRRGIYSFIGREMLHGTHTYNLVATPNVPAMMSKIVGLLASFAVEQDLDFRYNHDFFEPSPYAAEELSGNNDSPAAVRFSLIPSEEQEVMLEEEEEGVRIFDYLAARYPAIRFTTPSILEGICYWRTLAAAGNNLTKTQLREERTDITHSHMGAYPLPDAPNIPGIPYIQIDAFTEGSREVVLDVQSAIAVAMARVAVS